MRAQTLKIKPLIETLIKYGYVSTDSQNILWDSINYLNENYDMSFLKHDTENDTVRFMFTEEDKYIEFGLVYSESVLL